MWLKIVTTVVVGLVAYVIYFINQLLQERRQLDGLPQPPMPSKLGGHLYVAQECMKVFPAGAHSHIWFDYIREKWSLPETFCIDIRPFGYCWLVTADPEFAMEYCIGNKQSLPKADSVKEYLIPFLGKNNMPCVEGADWKALRSMFNPGFSATNIMTYSDAIVEACLRFNKIIQEKAKTNEIFRMEEHATLLTMDVIGVAVLDVDMQAQSSENDIVKYFRQRVKQMPGAGKIYPWQDVDLLRPIKLWINNRNLEAAVGRVLDEKIRQRSKELQAGASQDKIPKKRSIVDLALNAYEQELALGDVSGQKVKHILIPEEIPKKLRQDIVDSVKTFIFAGHDTTSTAITYCYYLLHRHPQAQKQLEAELDHYFPPGASIAETIRQDPYIVNKLEYTNAVIKESLRIFPPASSIRTMVQGYMNKPPSVRDPKTGQDLTVEGADVWIVAHMIHRNKRFFPQPTEFVPERWISSCTPYPDSELFTPAGKNAFQAFSAGPRNCIGQELAMLESRIILALTAREFDFVLEYPGEEVDPQPPIPESTAYEFSEETEYGRGVRNGTTKARIVEGHRCWPVLTGTAKPNGGAPGRVYLRRQAKQ